MSLRTYATEFGTLAESAHAQIDGDLAPAFDPDEQLEFEVYVPDAPGPKGLVVYISPKPGAAVPESWCPLLDDLGLVWVGAKHSGNQVAVARRAGLALLAPAVAAVHADMDDRRLLTGFSGGGRVASMLMQTHPAVFGGAIYLCGANPLLLVTPEQIETIRSKPLLFLTGTGDFNLDDTQMALSTYRAAGLHNAILEIVDGLDHALPAAEAMSSALRYVIDKML